MPGYKILGIKKTATCQYCHEDNNPQYLFVFCSKTHDFWKYFSNCYKTTTNLILTYLHT